MFRLSETYNNLVIKDQNHINRVTDHIKVKSKSVFLNPKWWSWIWTSNPKSLNLRPNPLMKDVRTVSRYVLRTISMLSISQLL